MNITLYNPSENIRHRTRLAVDLNLYRWFNFIGKILRVVASLEQMP